ncbi:hypothetical protein NDU88_006691 [Pleurodeles waltl]|uniref:Uncharacterized protein n=1 Tax=Pleurodeles waltl TaxID=8319 RepID=A0AAV7VPU1_PLEWA|nr:hypothetical protein NDU88_006691 [Pleurodeles waltl]
MGRTKDKQFEDMETPTSGGPAPMTSAKGQTDKLDVILQEIKDSREAIEHRLGAITTELSILKDDQRKLPDRIKQIKTSVAEILPTHRENKNIFSNKWRLCRKGSKMQKGDQAVIMSS